MHWSTCAKIFATYKIRMEAHASNLLKVEFASLWLKKHEKLKHSEGTHTLTQRHTEHLDVEDAALVMKPDDDEVLEQEEKRLLRLMSTVT